MTPSLRVSFLSTLSFIFLFSVFTGCQSNDSIDREPDGDLENARVNDFPLFEVDYLDISIVHPEIEKGVEIEHGKIEITIPQTQRSLMLSLKEFEPGSDTYHIMPSVGEQQDFSKGSVTYTVISNFNADRVVHYDVTVVYGGEPVKENALVTGFGFEKNKNPGLSTPVEAGKIVMYTTNSRNAIYVMVPVGTDFTNLTPTITYDAAKLYYSTTGSDFSIYPENGLAIDFKYPKQFYLQAENSFGTRSNVYTIIVDVKDPIKFDQPVIVTTNVKKGTGTSSENFSAVIKWTNQGNHPVTGMTASDYKDKIYPGGYTGSSNVITSTLSNPVIGTTGVLPGEKGDVNVKVNKVLLTGIFKTTAVFTPTFSFDTKVISYWPADDRIEPIFESAVVTIQTTIEE